MVGRNNKKNSQRQDTSRKKYTFAVRIHSHRMVYSFLLRLQKSRLNEAEHAEGESHKQHSAHELIQVL